MKKILIIILCCWSNLLWSHHIDNSRTMLRQWTLVKENKTILGSFLMFKNGDVYIEDEKSKVVHFPLSDFSTPDREFASKKYEKVKLLNQQLPGTIPADNRLKRQNENKLWILMAFFFTFGIFIYTVAEKAKRKYLQPIFYLGLLTLLYGFNDKKGHRVLTTTDPLFIDSAFTPFKPKVFTHWDNTYFYVESKGIPDHTMMVGITGWQQQVPIPQCYTTANNNNAWSIPLNPVIAATPVPVNTQHFLRGAIAVAANGIAIFNPYTNTGVDAYLDGQLDEYGGHCGRADDYHYHIAPMVLYNQTSPTSPIAFGLDGFAVYGTLEPDGTAMLPLDANHGHYGSNGVYHYHGTSSFPYMIGNMVGQVTEDNTMQIIPQAAARPVRPSLTPLTGAVITDCQANAGNNGYNLSYTKSGQTYHVNYDWVDTTNNNSKYTFRFISPTSEADSIYVGFSQSQCSVPTHTTITGVSKTMLRLPDTGENTGYTNTPGEDADYSINPPYFINNLNGIITDTVTGLMWQKTDGGEMTFENAKLYCDTLTLGGYSNWRLPTAIEGFSILNQQYANPAIDTNYFTKTLADYWWTSQQQPNDSTKIWCTNAGGGIGNKPKSETISAGGTFRYHTRAVRDVNTPAIIPNHFTNNNNGTITDNLTTLMWQRTPYKDTLTWENALVYADSLTLAGYTDWRLPNVKELQSISDVKLMNPALDTNYFKISNNKKYWSSTTLPNHTDKSWYLNSKYGITTYDFKTASDYVLCVRGNAVITTYIFNGDGNWDIPANWQNNSIPPALLPSGCAIIIDPVSSGQCVLNITQHIAPGASITVNANKKFLVPGALYIQQ